eukprot:5067025-Pyramimonas_sp.AAC.1
MTRFRLGGRRAEVIFTSRNTSHHTLPGLDSGWWQLAGDFRELRREPGPAGGPGASGVCGVLHLRGGGDEPVRPPAHGPGGELQPERQLQQPLPNPPHALQDQPRGGLADGVRGHRVAELRRRGRRPPQPPRAVLQALPLFVLPLVPDGSGHHGHKHHHHRHRRHLHHGGPARVQRAGDGARARVDGQVEEGVPLRRARGELLDGARVPELPHQHRATAGAGRDGG